MLDSMQEQGAQRLDKWLWAARFFKTRSLANQAVELGRVRLAGSRIKEFFKGDIETLLLSTSAVIGEVQAFVDQGIDIDWPSLS